MSQSQNILIQKLDEFINRYHKVRLIKGILISLALLLSFFLFAVILEYYGRFSTPVRAVLLFGYLGTAGYFIYKYIVQPLLELFRLSRQRLGYARAASIVGTHFPEISDKLLNALQLQAMHEIQPENEFLLAAINQKTVNMLPVPFVQAVRMEDLRKYGKIAVLPVTLFLVLLFFKAGIFTESATRIIQYNKHFAIPAPFDFILANETLETFKNEDLEIVLDTKGEKIPEEMYLVLPSGPVKMENRKNGRFAFTLRNLQQNIPLSFQTGIFNSDPYHIKVIPRPVVSYFSIQINYPTYLNKASEKIENTGDLSIPAGTEISWKINTTDAEKVLFYFDSTEVEAKKTAANSFEYQKKFRESTTYCFKLSNKQTESRDSLKFNIRVIPDEYPAISARHQQDSQFLNQYYLFGEASDDYGISALALFYRIKDDGLGNAFVRKDLAVKDAFRQNFFLPVNIQELGANPGQEIEYYFVVWDNDKVSGHKSAKTPLMVLKRETEKELEEKMSESGKAITGKLEASIVKAGELKKKSQELKKELMQKNNMTWEDKQKLEKLLEEQAKLAEEIEKLKQENKDRNKFEEQFKEKSEEVLKKQELLEKLFEELLDEKTKELFKKLEEMLKQQNKEQIQKSLQEMDKENSDLEKMLDNALEQFKMLEVEKLMEESIEKLEQLAEKQEQLKEKTEQSTSKSDNEALKAEQEKLKQEFEELKEKLKELDQKNQNLESPMEMTDQKESQKKVSDEMQESSDNLSKNKKQKSSENQENAAEEMKKMAKQMEQDLEEATDEQQEEDYRALRQLLKNLVELSLEQENIMEEYREIRQYNPRFIELAKKQKDLRQNAKMIEDSLSALAKRQPMISAYILKENSKMIYNMEEAIGHLSERNSRSSLTNQQYAMTHTNNLALLLTEVLQQMQQQMQESMQKKKDKDGQKNKDGKPKDACKSGKPGEKGDGGKSGLKGMDGLQKSLSKSMEQLLKDMKDGKQPGSKEFAKIAAQQEALRKELEKLAKELKEGGNKGLGDELSETQKMMEQTEKELYNKQITEQTLKRQRDIEHRLFEHEKAEREQGEKEERKGETAQEVERKLPPSIEKYLKEKAKEMEFYRTLPPEFTPYYRERVKEYFRNIQ